MSTPSVARRKAGGKSALTALEQCTQAALEDMKAVNIKRIDVRGLTDVADTLFIASGNSDRHVRSIADRVVEFAKQSGRRPMGVEGARDGEWVLVDLQDVLVHVMLPRVREFYALEQLWEPPPPARGSAPARRTSATRPAAKRSAAKQPSAKRAGARPRGARPPARRRPVR